MSHFISMFTQLSSGLSSGLQRLPRLWMSIMSSNESMSQTLSIWLFERSLQLWYLWMSGSVSTICLQHSLSDKRWFRSSREWLPAVSMCNKSIATHWIDVIVSSRIVFQRQPTEKRVSTRFFFFFFFPIRKMSIVQWVSGVWMMHGMCPCVKQVCFL